MDWIRFDKKLPPEDTTIMVSNGPAIGHYHFKSELFSNLEHQESTIPLWELNGTRHDVKVSDILQWCLKPSKPAPRKEIKLTRWERFKMWLKWIK